MKVRLYQEGLETALNIVSKFTGSKDIIDHVLLQAEGDGVTITGTNLVQVIRRKEPAIVDEPGSLLLPCSKLLSYVKELPKEIVRIEKQGGEVRVLCQRHKGSMPSINPEMFPKVRDISKEAEHFTIDATALVLAISQAGISAASNQKEPVLSCLYLEVSKGLLEITSADGLRLSHTEIPITGGGEFHASIPAKALNELSRLFSEGTLDIAMDKTTVVFTLGSTILTSLISSGAFPAYRAAVPTSSNMVLTVNRQDFIRAVKATTVLGEDYTVVIEPGEKTVAIHTKAAPGKVFGGETEMDANIEGELVRIALNSESLVDALNTLEEENTEIAVKDNKSAIKIKGVGDTKLFHLIMPVILVGPIKEIAPKPTETLEENTEELNEAIEREIAGTGKTSK